MESSTAPNVMDLAGYPAQADADDAEQLEESKEQPLFQRLYELSDPEKQTILKEQTDRLKASLQYMATLYPTWIKAFKKYRSIAEPLVDDLGREITGRANVFVPYPWAIVESEMPRLAGRLPRVHAFPRKRTEQAKVDAIQDLILYSLDRMGFLKLQQLWIRQFEIYGFSPLVYFWRNESRNVFERVKNEQLGTYELQRQEKTIWDDFAGRVIDVFDSFLQPGVDSAEDGDWFIFREFFSAKDLKAKVEAGVLYPEVLEYIKDNKSGSFAAGGRMNDTGRSERDSLIANDKNNTGFQQHSYGRYELLWTLENERVICVLDGKILAACGDNPEPTQQKAMINVNLMPQVNEPIGISVIEALGGLPDKLNALSNSRLDNISLMMNKVILANRFSQTDFENLVMTAGNVILTDDVEKAVKFLEVPDIGEASARELMTTKEEMQFTVGISDYIVGAKGSGKQNNTATGVSSIIREGNARFALKLSTFEAYALRRLVEAIHTYNMMYMSEEKKIHVLGPKGYVVKDIALEDIMVECDFIIEPGSSMPLDQKGRQEALLQLMDRVIQLPQVVDIPKLMKEVFHSFDIPSPEDFLIQRDMLTEGDDVKLAEAENIALLQNQEIALRGNNQLHLMVHQRGLSQAKTQEEMQRIQAHIQAHMQNEQQMVAPTQQAGAQNALFGNAGGPPQGIAGGQNASESTQATPGAAPGGSGGQPQVGGGSGIPQGAGGGNPPQPNGPGR